MAFRYDAYIHEIMNTGDELINACCKQEQKKTKIKTSVIN